MAIVLMFLGLKSVAVCREGIRDHNDFLWQMQLRYAWSETADDVVIRQVNARSAQTHYLCELHISLEHLRSVCLTYLPPGNTCVPIKEYF